MMRVFPAIDLRGGQVVRLTQGDYGRQKVYAEDPLMVAKGFRQAGAAHLHVVDLDGAKAGRPENLSVLTRLAEQSGLFIQAGGGLRTPGAVEAVLSMGVGRAILGTAALEDRPFLEAMLAKYGDRIAVGVDARGGYVCVEGWTETSQVDAYAFCEALSDLGVRTIIYTDIERDGALKGANLAAYRKLRAIPGLAVIASGGVTGPGDITALAEMGVYGVIIGKALYEGRLSLADALRLAGEEPPC